MTTIQKAPRSTTDQAVLDKMSAELLNGTYFARRSAIAATNEHCAYRPPIRHYDYADLLGGFAAMAATSDRMATLASRMLAQPFNLRANAFQIEASVYDRARRALATPYDDVLARTGPEPIRHSDALDGWTLSDRIRLAISCDTILAPFAAGLGKTPGIGWALAALADENRIAR